MSQTFNESTAEQLTKFNEINALSESAWNRKCLYYNNCAICPMAIHQHMSSTTKHRCTYGMGEMMFRLLVSSDDCEY